MAFKNMDKRFEATMRELYDHASTRDGGPNGRNNEPFLEFKPYDPRRNETRNDSRAVPIGSIRRDVVRVGNYLKSNDGLLFLVKQQTLQTGNVFTQTRLLNPLFVIGNLQPYARIRRVLNTPASAPPTGDLTQMSPASRGQTGAAGRLQKATSASVLATIVNGNNSKGLLSFLDPSRFVSTIGGAFGVGSSAGSLGINQRPELNVAGEYFSIQLWKGFQKAEQQRGVLDQIGGALARGNISGALSAAGSALRNFLFGNVGTPSSLLNKNVGDRGNPLNTSLDGRRYFITSATTADRYLQDSVLVNGEGHPVSQTPYLNRTPYILNANAPLQNTLPAPIPRTPTKIQQTATQARTGFFGSFASSFASSFTDSLTKGLLDNLATTANAASSPNLSSTSDNPAEDRMQFDGKLSLASRYKNDSGGRATFIKEQLEAQRKAQTAYWNSINSESNRGIAGGIRAGTTLDPNPNSKVRFAGGLYFTDTLNTEILDNNTRPIGPISINAGELNVPDSVKRNNDQDFINVLFFDYVNATTIPFRAFVSGISETVSPEISDTRYIGRIDRNIVYVGVNRELSLTLRIHAFSKSDMDGIWKKINYMTGLCYPSKYVKGFMVPPFVKLTLGNLYVDQPGYIKSINHQIEDDASWELDDGKQAPHGIIVNLTFCCIEKSIVSSTSTFYPVGNRA